MNIQKSSFSFNQKRKKKVFFLSASLLCLLNFFHNFSKEIKRLVVSNVSKDTADQSYLKAKTFLYVLPFFVTLFLILIPKISDNYFYCFVLSFLSYFSSIFILKYVSNKSQSLCIKRNIDSCLSNVIDLFSVLVIMVGTNLFVFTEVKQNMFYDDTQFDINCNSYSVFGGSFYYAFIIFVIVVFRKTSNFFINYSPYFLLFISVIFLLIFFLLEREVNLYLKSLNLENLKFKKDMITRGNFIDTCKSLRFVTFFIFNNSFIRHIFINESLFFGTQVLVENFNSNILSDLSKSICVYLKNKQLIPELIYFAPNFTKDENNRNNIPIYIFSSVVNKHENKKPFYLENIKFFITFCGYNTKEITLPIQEQFYCTDYALLHITEKIEKIFIETVKIFLYTISSFIITIMSKKFKNVINKFLKSKKDITFEYKCLGTYNSYVQFILSLLFFLLSLGKFLFFGKDKILIGKIFFFFAFSCFLSFHRLTKYQLMDIMRNNIYNQLNKDWKRPSKSICELFSSRIIKEIFFTLVVFQNINKFKPSVSIPTCYIVICSIWILHERVQKEKIQ